VTRIRSISGSVVTLAENGESFTAGQTCAIYKSRNVYTRYQRIASDGTLYKDFDIAWSSANASLPPIPIIDTQRSDGAGGWESATPINWVAVGESIRLDASNSQAANGGTISSYTWDADGGSITGSGAAVSVLWSAAGFYYLKLTVTDSNGVSTVTYRAIWVGDTHLYAVDDCSIRWTLNRGQSAAIRSHELPTAVGIASVMLGTPTAIVDLETKDTYLFGFAVPGTDTRDFEDGEADFALEDALAYAGRLSAFPFILVDDASPNSWDEVADLTLERAAWFLLYWHTTIPQVVNTLIVGIDSRRIAGQPFPDGTIGSQLQGLAGDAKYTWRGGRNGGMLLWKDFLFVDSSDWAALTPADFSDSEDLYGETQREPPVPRLRDVRLAGVYYAAGGKLCGRVAGERQGCY